MKLFVIDPGLDSDSGHHAGFLSLLLSIKHKEVSKNHQFIVFSHQSLQGKTYQWAKNSGIIVYPHFRSRFYDVFETDKNAIELNNYINQLALEYLSAMQQIQSQTESGIILYHTMDWPHLFALNLALQLNESGNNEILHAVFLMFNLGISHSEITLNLNRRLHYYLALQRIIKYPRVKIYASCFEISVSCQVMLGKNSITGLHPCFLINDYYSSMLIDNNQTKFVSLNNSVFTLYLGDAKDNKGFLTLPNHLEQISKIPAPDLSVQIHYNTDIGLTSEAIDKTIFKIKTCASKDKRIFLFECFLDHVAWIEVIRNSNLIIMEYDCDYYSNKTSGLLWLTSYLEKPLILIGESWLSREARRLNPWIQIFSTRFDFYNALVNEGGISFNRNLIDIGYRTSLFQPFTEFIESLEKLSTSQVN